MPLRHSVIDEIRMGAFTNGCSSTLSFMHCASFRLWIRNLVSSPETLWTKISKTPETGFAENPWRIQNHSLWSSVTWMLIKAKTGDPLLGGGKNWITWWTDISVFTVMVPASQERALHTLVLVSSTYLLLIVQSPSLHGRYWSGESTDRSTSAHWSEAGANQPREWYKKEAN